MNFLPELHQPFVVNEEIQGREEDGSGLLETHESHEGPLAMKLRNVPLAGDEGFRCLVHAMILAVIAAVPLDEVLENGDIEVLVSPQID